VLKDGLVTLQQQTKIKDERIAALQNNIEAMQRNLAAISEVLATNPSVAEVERALKQKSRVG